MGLRRVGCLGEKRRRALLLFRGERRRLVRASLLGGTIREGHFGDSAQQLSQCNLSRVAGCSPGAGAAVLLTRASGPQDQRQEDARALDRAALTAGRCYPGPNPGRSSLCGGRGALGVFVRDPHYPQNEFEGHDQAVRISLLFWFLFLKITKAFCPSGLEETVIIFFLLGDSWEMCPLPAAVVLKSKRV